MRTFWENSRDEKAKNWREFVTGWFGGGFGAMNFGKFGS